MRNAMRPQQIIGSCVVAIILAGGSPRANAQATSVVPAAAVGRSAASGESNNGPFVSSTLPSTGHATRFKRYAGIAQPQRPPQYQNRNSVSPYLNLLRGGDPGLNYHLGVVRDRAIYAAAVESQSTSTELGGLRRDLQATPQQPITLRPKLPEPSTPLKRQVTENEAQAERKAENSNAVVLQEILKELRTIREKFAAPGQKQD